MKPTLQLESGIPVNDDPALEREADAMEEVQISPTEMVDRMGSQVIRSGDTFKSDRIAVHPTGNCRILYFIRYMVGSELHSESVQVDCAVGGQLLR